MGFLALVVVVGYPLTFICSGSHSAICGKIIRRMIVSIIIAAKGQIER
jgi:hypothetical protein